VIASRVSASSPAGLLEEADGGLVVVAESVRDGSSAAGIIEGMVAERPITEILNQEERPK
jgi:hypothetical protein